MARAKPTEADDVDTRKLGEEGETCSQCGTLLATDQRYCLNCGTPRAQPRLDFERALAPPTGAGATQSGARGQAPQWTPLAAVVAIAILGGMLLLGVLIGQDDNEITVTEVQRSEATDTGATTTESTPTEPTTTTPTTTTPTAPEDSGAADGSVVPPSAEGGVEKP